MAAHDRHRSSVATAVAFALLGVACGSTSASFDVDASDVASRDAEPVDAGADARAGYGPPAATSEPNGGDGQSGEPSSTPSPLDTCLEACETKTPAGVAKIRSVFACAEVLCNAACVGFVPPALPDGGDADVPPVCAAVGRGPGKFTWFDEGCDACLVAECCTSITACVGDVACDTVNQCQDHCYDAGN